MCVLQTPNAMLSQEYRFCAQNWTIWAAQVLLLLFKLEQCLPVYVPCHRCTTTFSALQSSQQLRWQVQSFQQTWQYRSGCHSKLFLELFMAAGNRQLVQNVSLLLLQIIAGLMEEPYSLRRSST